MTSFKIPLLLLIKSWTFWYIERLPTSWIQELHTFKNDPVFCPPCTCYLYVLAQREQHRLALPACIVKLSRIGRSNRVFDTRMYFWGASNRSNACWHIRARAWTIHGRLFAVLMSKFMRLTLMRGRNVLLSSHVSNWHNMRRTRAALFTDLTALCAAPLSI